MANEIIKNNQQELILQRAKTLEQVSEWPQHQDISKRAQREVLKTMVALPAEPSEAQADKLLDLVGDHHKVKLREVLPAQSVKAIIGERDPKYTVSDLATEFGVDKVYAAIDYMWELGESKKDDEESHQEKLDTVAVLGATKIASVHDLDTSQEISSLVERYSEEREISVVAGFNELVAIDADEASLRMDHKL